MGLNIPSMLRLGLPADRFVAHGPRGGQLAECGIDATGIAAAVTKLVEDPGAAPAEGIIHRTIVSR